MIYCVSYATLDSYNESIDADKAFDELTNSEVKELAGDWCFENWEEFVRVFNSDGDYAPYPSEDYIRVIK